jgi:DNA-binding transcriptional LysR family regulator
MRTTQLRQADLNLLIVFAVMAEERNISRAATRLGLTQPAMSRAMQRARDMFRDDLLVRTRGTFQPTPLGQRLLRELEVILPRLDQLLTGTGFDPTKEELTFRITATDYGSSLVCEPLCQEFLPKDSKITFRFVPRSDTEFDELEHGQLDLVLRADDGKAPASLSSEFLFDEEFVCVMAKELPYSRRLTLKQYLSERHIGMSGAQSLPERSLALAGAKRNCAMMVPYFTAAISAVAGTNFVATVPRRIAESEAHRPDVKILKAPQEFAPFRYMMFWHPRMNTDAAHSWLRSAMKTVGQKIGSK